MSNDLRKIVVLGNDIEAWMAATLLASQQILSKPEIRIMTSVSGCEDAQIQAPLPTFTSFLKKVGIAPETLINQCNAIPRLGTNYHLQSGRFAHIWGEYGAKRGLIDFHQILLKATRLGEKIDLNEMSVASAAILQGKLAISESNPASIFSTFESSITFSSSKFIGVLSARARKLGVVVDQRQVNTISVSDSKIVVTLVSKEEFAVDFAVNSSKYLRPSASIYECWADYIPYSLYERRQSECQSVGVASDTILNDEADWEISHYVRSAVEVSRYRLMTASSEGSLGADSVSGCLQNPLNNRLLQIGKAAVCLPSLLVSEVDLAWISLSSLVKYFPSVEPRPNTEAAYNEAVVESFQSLRDLTQLVIELMAEQRKLPSCGDHIAVRSEEIRHRRELFSYRGKLPVYEHEVINSAWQTWLLFGLGLVPKVVDPIADATDDAQVRQVITAVKNAVSREVKMLTDFF